MEMEKMVCCHMIILQYIHLSQIREKKFLWEQNKNICQDKGDRIVW